MWSQLNRQTQIRSTKTKTTTMIMRRGAFKNLYSKINTVENSHRQRKHEKLDHRCLPIAKKYHICF